MPSALPKGRVPQQTSASAHVALGMAGPSTAISGASPGTQLDVKGTAGGFVVATPQGIRGGTQPGAEATQRGGGAQALAAAAAAKVSSLGARLLPARRWSNATSEGDPLHAIESTETDAPDDVAFMRDVAACVRDGLRVGISDRVFLAGWSQGSKLASALVCAPQFSGAQGGGFSVAALAVGAGLAAESCPASARTPLLLLQGGSDDLVPFCHAGAPYKATREALNAWAQARGCPQLGARDGWRARCGAQGDGGDALRVYEPAKCNRSDAAPLVLYWLPKLPHDVPSGDLPGLAGGFGDLFVGFLRSVRDGGAGDTAPLRSAAPGQPPLAACSGSDPCS